MGKTSNLETVEARLAALELRNQKVEADKAWETSWTRRLCILGLTYAILALYFGLVLQVDPWLNALVPAAGFTLSTLTISYVKGWWLARRK